MAASAVNATTEVLATTVRSEMMDDGCRFIDVASLNSVIGGTVAGGAQLAVREEFHVTEKP
jgi:hypothetical protein